MRALLNLVTIAALSALANAQLSYDAGTAGNPPVAPSPTTQGWAELVTGGVTVTDISPDPTVNLNAWQITDTGVGRATYSTTSHLQLPIPFEIEVTMRILAGSAVVTIDTGDTIIDSRSEIVFESDGTDVVVQRPFFAPIVCPDGAIGYHTYTISGAYYYQYLRYDGELVGVIFENADPLDEYFTGIRWGTGSADGRVRFHRVDLRATDRGLHLEDDRFCSPAVPNSSGLPAYMYLSGSHNVPADDLTLLVEGAPTGPNIGYFIMGTGANEFVPPGAAGPICVAPGLKRYLPPVNNTNQLGAGGFSREVGTSGPVSGMITPGSTWRFQAWFRDGMNPSNLSNAIEVTFQ